MKFQTPPVHNRVGSPTQTTWKVIAAKLRRKPQKWAKVWHYPIDHNANAMASRVNTDKTKLLPASEFEARAHEGDLYLRYIGNSAATPVNIDLSKVESA